MVTRGDPELRAAAARVFVELEPRDAAVLASLGAALRVTAGPASLYALRALAASPSPEAVAQMIPALVGPPELRQEATDAIARFGRGALPYLRTALFDGELPLRKAAATVLARIGGKPAHELLLRALAEGNLELSKHLCFELDLAIRQMPDEARAALTDLVLSYLGDKRTRANDTALASGLILLGFLRSPRGKVTLLAFARPKNPPEVRHRALLALRGIADSLTAAECAALAAYLEEGDVANVAAPAIEVLRPLPLPPSVAERLIHLVASPHQAVRDFAVLKMGGLDTPAAAKTLVEQLDAPQPALREAAVASLQNNAGAVPLLLKRARAEADPSRLWTLVRVLEHHAGSIGAAHAKALLGLLLTHLAEGDRRAEALSYLLRRVAPKALDAALLKQAVAMKKKGAFAEADRMLTVLLRGGEAPPEALYEAAVVALKHSPKGLGRHERHADPCLERFDRLIGLAGFDLTQRLCAEACVEPGDLFYVGFHFAEQLSERREFGGALLRHVIAAAPRSALAASARNKLRLEAFPVEAAPLPKPSAPAKTAKGATRPKPAAARARAGGP